MFGNADTCRSLKGLLNGGGNLRFIEAHNGLSSIIASTARDEHTATEFDGLWVSSLTCTAAAGLPDLELSLVDRRLTVIGEIIERARKPVIVDGDTGGDISSLRYFSRALDRMGCAGIVVEEKGIPKRNSLDDSHQSLADPSEFAAKLAASKEGLEQTDFMVVARLESLTAGRGMADALKRASIYAAVGIDGILIHSKSRTDREVREFTTRFRQTRNDLPVFCIPTTYHAATATDLFSCGIQGVIYANHQLRAAHAAMWNACLSILRHDRSTEIEDDITSTKQLFDEVGYTAEVARIAQIEDSIARAKSATG